MIKYGWQEKGVGVSGVKVDYIQDGDAMGGDDMQLLEVQATDAGGGYFFVIKTERWAFDNIEELVNILRDFEKRIGEKE